MSWSKDLKNIIVKNEKLTEKQLRAGLFDAANTVILGSPVGNPDLWLWNHPELGYVDYVAWKGEPKNYKGGQYRSNHRVSIGAPTTTVRSISGIGVLQRRMDKAIGKFKIGKTIYVTNPLPYANRLEYGWSTQAGDGIYRPAIIRLIKFLNTELKAK